MIELRAVPGPTGRLLATLLRERDVEVTLTLPGQRPVDVIAAVVSYGVPVSNGTVPVLNAAAGRLNKYEEMHRLHEKGILVPPHSLDGSGLTFPILGRKFKHSKARDIVPILQNDREFEWRKQGGHCDYYVQYIPRQREYRVWGYRRRPLAVYEKVMRYPDRYGVGRTAGIGWNWNHGFAFEFLRNASEALKELGTQAIDALGLDFGAVDIIQDTNGRLFVLETNTAPGVQDVRQGISHLADKIARWVAGGFLRRNGDVNPNQNNPRT